MNDFPTWFSEFQALRADACLAVAKVTEHLGRAPSPAGVRAVEALLALRSTLGVHGPASPEAIDAAAERIRGPLSAGADAVRDAGMALLHAAEGALADAARRGEGLVRTDDFADRLVIEYDPYPAQVIGVVRSLPEGHPLRSLLPPEECYQTSSGPSLILGPPAWVAESAARPCGFVAAAWYPLAPVAAVTRKWRLRQCEEYCASPLSPPEFWTALRDRLQNKLAALERAAPAPPPRKAPPMPTRAEDMWRWLADVDAGRA